jgi:hypothetical protein
MQGLICLWVIDVQIGRIQFEPITHFKCLFMGVEAITDNGMADKVTMHTQLVRATRDGFELKERGFIIAFQNRPVCF